MRRRRAAAAVLVVAVLAACADSGQNAADRSSPTGAATGTSGDVAGGTPDDAAGGTADGGMAGADNPVVPDDFPDPDLLEVDGTYYAYATNGNSRNGWLSPPTC